MEVCQLHAGLVERIDKCETDIKRLQDNDNDLNTRQVRVETKLDYISDQLITLSKKIDRILEKPEKRMDSLSNALVTGVISIIVAALVAKLVS